MGVFIVGLLAWVCPEAPVHAASHPVTVERAAGLAQAPLAYEPNDGQFSPDVLFAARGSGFALVLTRTSVTLTPDGSLQPAAAIRLRFAHAGAHPLVHGVQPLQEHVNYFLGRNPARWHADVPTYGRVEYSGLYPGIDLLFRGTAATPEFDWIVHPGANSGRIGLAVSGARVQITGAGLVLRAAGHTVSMHAPRVYQQLGGRRIGVAAGYTVRGDVVRVTLGRYNRSRPLVIDPTLAFSRLTGGSNLDNVNGIATDPTGNTFVVGDTQSADFPTVGGLTNAMFQKSCSPTDLHCRDVFVMELNPKGAVVFSTFLGGSGYDTASGIAVDAVDNVYVSGHTGSADFPLTNPLQTSFSTNCPAEAELTAGLPCRHVFVTKLDSSGAKLDYSTYFGGSGDDLDGLVAVDAPGNAYLTGMTESADLPGRSGTGPSGTCDSQVFAPVAGHVCTQVFLAKLSPSGLLDYDVYFGGSGDDAPTSIALSPGQEPVISGLTDSSDFPTMNAPQSGLGSGGGNCSTNGQARACIDGFVAQFNSGDGTLAFSSTLGGSGDNYATQVAFDPGGSMYIAGFTYAQNFPVASALQSTKPAGAAGDASCTLTKLSSSFQVAYSTYLGGSQDAECYADAVDQSGDVFVGGKAASASGLSLPGAIQASYGGGDADGYVAELNPAGSSVIFGTLLGGSGHDEVDALAVNSVGVSVGGWTASPNFPVTAAQTVTGGGDGFMTSIDLTPPKPPVKCPKNSTMKKGKCTCKKGYVMKKGKCVKKKA
jgi:hypothetical protein